MMALEDNALYAALQSFIENCSSGTNGRQIEDYGYLLGAKREQVQHQLHRLLDHGKAHFGFGYRIMPGPGPAVDPAPPDARQRAHLEELTAVEETLRRLPRFGATFMAQGLMLRAHVLRQLSTMTEAEEKAFLSEMS